MIIVCFSTAILISFGILKFISWLKPNCRFKVSPFRLALNPTPDSSKIFSWPCDTPKTALAPKLLLLEVKKFRVANLSFQLILSYYFFKLKVDNNITNFENFISYIFSMLFI